MEEIPLTSDTELPSSPPDDSPDGGDPYLAAYLNELYNQHTATPQGAEALGAGQVAPPRDLTPSPPRTTIGPLSDQEGAELLSQFSHQAFAAAHEGYTAEGGGAMGGASLAMATRAGASFGAAPPRRQQGGGGVGPAPDHTHDYLWNESGTPPHSPSDLHTPPAHAPSPPPHTDPTTPPEET